MHRLIVWCLPELEQHGLFFRFEFFVWYSQNVLKVVDRTFHGSPDFISIIPFGILKKCAGVRSQILFGIDINNSPSGWRIEGFHSGRHSNISLWICLFLTWLGGRWTYKGVCRPLLSLMVFSGFTRRDASTWQYGMLSWFGEWSLFFSLIGFWKWMQLSLCSRSHIKGVPREDLRNQK